MRVLRTYEYIEFSEEKMFDLLFKSQNKKLGENWKKRITISEGISEILGIIDKELPKESRRKKRLRRKWYKKGFIDGKKVGYRFPVDKPMSEVIKDRQKVL